MNFENYAYTWLILWGIGAFFAVRLLIGYLASRRVSNAADYIVAGRRLPIYIAGASIMATWFGAEALMGASAQAYRTGFHGVIFDPFGAVACLLLSGLFFIRLMRRAKYLTVVDFFEKRYGPAMGALASAAQLLTYFGWTAAQIVAGGTVLHALLGWDPLWAMIGVGLIVTAYTTMGGMWADTLLDFIQMFFTAGGITILFLYVLQVSGGWPDAMANAAVLGGNDPFTLLPSAADGYLGYQGCLGTLYWIAAWMTVGFGSIACQDLMQRSMSAHNEATSVWGTYLAAALYFVFGVMSPLIGIMMYGLQPDLPANELNGLLVFAAMKYVPPVVAAIFIAALASALMSTSDSSILAGASVVTENLLPRIWPDMDDRRKLLWTRIMVVVIGLASIGIAAAITNIYKLATISWALLLVGLFVPFALGMYWRKANGSGAVAAFLGGFATWLAGLVCLYPTTAETNTAEGEVDVINAVWDAVYISSAPAVGVSLVLMVAVSLLTQRRDPPRLLTDADGAPLPLEKRLGWMAPKDVW
jgi:SSS family transporter